MKRPISVSFGILLCVLLAPNTTSAQGTSAASITGTVKDASGAVLPGVTVEASSPVLIEKMRTTVTDDQGQYRITELRTGVYSVTFTLPGFNVFKRDGLELPPNFTATINVDLRVGAVEETVTVSGQSPLVDTTNVTQQRVISKGQLDAVPTSKSFLGVSALMPAGLVPPTTQDVGGSKGEQTSRLSVHGASTADSRHLLDGMSFNSLLTEGTGHGFYLNPLSAQEILIDTGSGGSAEYSLGGAQMNAIPRDGGNQFSGTFFGAWTGHQLQGDNFTDEIKAQGLTSINGVRELFDMNAQFAGPIVKDRLWFIASIRRSGSTTRVANLYHDANLEDFVFTSDLSRPVDPEEFNHFQNGRVTWQAASKHKFTVAYDLQRNKRDQNGGQLDLGGISIEAQGSDCKNADLFQSTWTHPRTNKLLFTGGFTVNRYGTGPNMGTDLYLRDYEQCGFYVPDKVSINDTGIGFTYHGTGVRSKTQSNQSNGRFTMSYVTGSHNFKTGIYYMADTFHGSYNERAPLDTNRIPLSYSFRNSVPSSVTEFISPNYSQLHMRPDLGIFVQDQWTMKRLTLSLGLRYDYMSQSVPPVHRDAGVLNDAADFPKVDCVLCWHDLNPRMGAAFDVFGDGKTALKVGLNRYVQATTVGIATLFAPAAASVASTSRSWNDSFYPVGDPRRGNFFPDCDLRNTATNAECGQMANTNFGKQVVTTNPDSDWITGWGKRPYTWAASVSLDRELMTGVAINTGYYRTWFGNFAVTDNLSVTPADFSPYCITAPTDSRLPSDISGQQICGLYDVNPDKFGLVNNIVTSAKNYGERSDVYNGFDLNINVRLPQGAQMAGGWNVGNSVVVSNTVVARRQSQCFVVDSPQELYNCDARPPYQSNFKLSGSYPLPWDIQAAAVYQNLPGVNYSASVSVPNAAIAPSLGRPLSGNTSAVTVQLLPPFSAFLDDRVNQLDLRFSKLFRIKGTRLQTNFDIYNVINTSTVLGVVSTYTTTGTNRWQRPTQVIDARLAKFSVQLDF